MPYFVGRRNVLIDEYENCLCARSRPTWKLFVSLHPSDGGGGLTAHGGAGHLRLVALSQHVIPGLDHGVTWRDYETKLSKHWVEYSTSTPLELHDEKTTETTYKQSFLRHRTPTAGISILY